MQRSLFWQTVSFVLDAAALSALLWLYLGENSTWYEMFSFSLMFVGFRQFYAPMWMGLKSWITGGYSEEKIVKNFLGMFGSRGYPPPRTDDDLNRYLQRTMSDNSLPEHLRSEAAGLQREFEFSSDFRTYEERLVKYESAEEAFAKFKETSAKDPYVQNFAEEEAWE